MSRAREPVRRWLAGRHIPADRVEAVLRLAGVLPTPDAWARLVDRLLLGLGTALLLSGVVSAVAANWQAIGRFGRLAVVDALIVGALLAVWRLGLRRPGGQAALFGAAVLVGVLLALVGQTYQTGADTYELFAAWALLILPWALLGRMPPLWLFWLGLVNLAGYLYFDTFGGLFGLLVGPRELLWLGALLNGLALVVWEGVAARDTDAARWAPRLLALAGGIPVSGLAMQAVFQLPDGTALLDLAFWVLYLALLGWVYRRCRPDLFMLAGGLLSVIVVCVAALIRLLAEPAGAATALLASAIVVLGLSSIGARWLAQIAREEGR